MTNTSFDTDKLRDFEADTARFASIWNSEHYKKADIKTREDMLKEVGFNSTDVSDVNSDAYSNQSYIIPSDAWYSNLTRSQLIDISTRKKMTVKECVKIPNTNMVTLKEVSTSELPINKIEESYLKLFVINSTYDVAGVTKSLGDVNWYRGFLKILGVKPLTATKLPKALLNKKVCHVVDRCSTITSQELAALDTHKILRQFNNYTLNDYKDTILTPVDSDHQIKSLNRTKRIYQGVALTTVLAGTGAALWGASKYFEQKTK